MDKAFHWPLKNPIIYQKDTEIVHFLSSYTEIGTDYRLEIEHLLRYNIFTGISDWPDIKYMIIITK